MLADNNVTSILLITGPTRERIDDVRFISNFSSGLMGQALANACRGDIVEIISGPVSVTYPDFCEVTYVESARSMLESVLERMDRADIIICCAAVCDYRPDVTYQGKLKKGSDDEQLSQINLVKNPDILKEISSRRRLGQVVVGFAAETDDLLKNARKKLDSKGCDMIVANDVSNSKTFGETTSEIVLVTKSRTDHYPLLSKKESSKLILDRAKDMLAQR